MGKVKRIMMANVPHVTSGSGLRKYQADGLLFDRVYIHLRGEGEVSKVQNISFLTSTIVILHSTTPVLPSYFIYRIFWNLIRTRI